MAQGLELVIASHDGRTQLLAEEMAAVDIHLVNRSSAPAANLYSVSMNARTPTVRVRDASGKVLFEKTPTEAAERLVGEVAHSFGRFPAQLVTLAPGEASSTWINLWSYTDPLPPGRYALDVVHMPRATAAPVLTSNALAFEVRAARVERVAWGYESAVHPSSFIAWTAAPADGKGPAELLLRVSASSSHFVPKQGAVSHGPVALDARVAVSSLVTDCDYHGLGWAAVTSGASVDLICHNVAHAENRTGPIALPVADPLPVPRFPDRGHAVFLATGTGASGALLAGVVAGEDGTHGEPWSVPLEAAPFLSACAAVTAEPIALLLASESGGVTTLTRIDVTEAGTVVAPARVLRTTKRRVLAIAVDQRLDRRAEFLVLEADRAEPDRLALTRHPLDGVQPTVVERPPLHAWPRKNDRPVEPLEVTLDVDPKGVPYLAFADADGNLYGAVADTSPLRLVASAKEHGRLSRPHVATLLSGTCFGAFDEQGYLRPVPAGGH